MPKPEAGTPCFVRSLLLVSALAPSAWDDPSLLFLLHLLHLLCLELKRLGTCFPSASSGAGR